MALQLYDLSLPVICFHLWCCFVLASNVCVNILCVVVGLSSALRFKWDIMLDGHYLFLGDLLAFRNFGIVYLFLLQFEILRSNFK